MDFPTTRGVLDVTDGFVQAFAATLPTPVKVPVKDSFRWEHPVRSVEAVQVAKAVRAISGLRAALRLADNRHTIECGVLLRTVADFSAEIIYLGEALVEKRTTPDQQKFVEQHFSPMPTDPDELAAREKEYYIGRKDIAKAYRRLIEKLGGQADQMAAFAAYLNKGYDSYVHGTNQSAMELYSGRLDAFMLRGHESSRHTCMMKSAVTGKLKEFLNALRVMALTRGAEALHLQIDQAWLELDGSGEDTRAVCAGLT